jgi:hypothetical protein
MKDDKRALFGRKINNLEELKEATLSAKKKGQIGSIYQVSKEIFLEDDDFKDFSQDFFKEQAWIEKTDGGYNDKGEIRCIRVVNIETGEKLLVNSEGYSYSRYTALEELKYCKENGCKEI